MNLKLSRFSQERSDEYRYSLKEGECVLGDTLTLGVKIDNLFLGFTTSDWGVG